MTNLNDIETLRKEFLVRYYQWSRKDFQREIKEGFPYLKVIKTINTIGFFDYISRLREKEIYSFCDVLNKARHSKALSLLGQSLSKDELNISDEYGKLFMSSFNNKLYDLISDMQKRGKYRKIIRRNFVSLIKKELMPIVGRYDSQRSAEWAHSLELGNGWKIITLIDMGRTVEQLQYEHRIVRKSEEKDIDEELIRGISFSVWLGVDVQTSWNSLENDQDAEEAVYLLRHMCKLFIDAAPQLLGSDR